MVIQWYQNITQRNSLKAKVIYSIFTFTFVLFFPVGNKILLSQEINNYENAANEENESEDFGSFEEDEYNFKISGYIKELFTFTKTDEYSEYMFTANSDRGKNLIANLNRIRLSPEFEYGDALLMHIDYDNEVITGSYLKSKEFDLFWRPVDYNDLLDLSYEPHYSNDIYYRHKIHTAYMKLVISDLTLSLGRQQVRFGSGRLWNPLDILNPISPTEIEGPEEQKGTDALRLEYYLSEDTELALVLNPGRRYNDIEKVAFDSTNIISRLKTTIGESDFALLSGKLIERYIAGGDLSAVLFDGMLTTGFIYSNPEKGNSYYQANAGYEYNFKSGIYFLVEYFYNKNSLNYNDELRSTYLQSIIFGMNEDYYKKLSNQFLTFNQHYAGIVLGYDITPLLRGDAFFMYDFQGNALFVSPSVKYNILQNMDISLSGMFARIFDEDAKDSDFDYLDEYDMFSGSVVWYF